MPAAPPPVPPASTLRATVQADGVNESDSASVLVDGAVTPVTANGVAGYVPKTGDRVLVQRVGGHVEILQFLTRTYVTGQIIRTSTEGNARVQIEQWTDATPQTYGRVAFFTGDIYQDTDAPSGIYAVNNIGGGANHGEYLLLTSGNMTDGLGTEVIGPTAPVGAPTLTISGHYNSTTHVVLTQIEMTAEEFSVAADTTVVGTLDVFGATSINDDLTVFGDLTLNGLLQLVNSDALHGIQFGVSTVHTSASATGSLVVNHGLGHTPAAVVGFAMNTTTYFATGSTRTSTQFTLNVRQFLNTAATNDIDVCWIAVW